MKLTQDNIDTVKLALRDPSLSHYHKRLQIVLFRSQGMEYKEIAKLLDCTVVTVWKTLKKYDTGGVATLTTETRGGRNKAYLTVGEEIAFLEQFKTEAGKGEYVTIDAMLEAYQALVGHKTTREGFYALLKRHGWRKVSPRPEHPKKADAETIQTSKNKI